MIRLFVSALQRIMQERSTELGRVAGATLALLFYATAGFMYYELDERPDLVWSDAFWWAIATMTTVGYGDIFPESFGGRFLVGLPTMLCGISILGYLLSMLSGFLFGHTGDTVAGPQDSPGVVLDPEARDFWKMVPEEAEETQELPAGLQDHIVIVHGPDIARVHDLLHDLALAGMNNPVVLLSAWADAEQPWMQGWDLHRIVGSPLAPEALDRANLSEAHALIVLANNSHNVDSDLLTLSVIVAVRAHTARLRVVAECVSRTNRALLENAGCEDVIGVEQAVAVMLVRGTLGHHIESPLLGLDGEHRVYVVAIERLHDWTLVEVERELAPNGHQIVAVLRDGELVAGWGQSDILVHTDQIVCRGPFRPAPICVTERT